MTPFKALYGYQPYQPPYHSFEMTTKPEVNDFLQERAQRAQLIKEHLQVSQARMEFYANKGRSERQFEMGDSVYLRVQPYQQLSLSKRRD